MENILEILVNILVHVNQRCLKQLIISPRIRQNIKLTQAERLDF